MGEIYCCNCGLQVSPQDLYCSRCGEYIKTRLNNEEQESCLPASLETSFVKAINCRDGKKKSIRNLLPKNNLFLAMICFSGFLSIIGTTYILVFDDNHHVNASVSQDEMQKERNIRICKQIANEYNRSHIYSGDIYDCDNMAQDVWNMLKAKGINSRIAVGDFEHGTANIIEDKKSVYENLDSGILGVFTTYNYICEDSGLLNSSIIDNLTHAWVLAEVSPGNWLAIECTGGYVVFSEKDGKYYRGLTFNNPKDYRIFLELYSKWQIQVKDYKDEQLYYNELLNSYNAASYTEQGSVLGTLEREEEILQEKEETFLKTDSELKALLRYG